MRRPLLILAVLLCARPLHARQVPVTVLHTSCVRGHVLPAEREGGGLLRVSSLVAAAREEAPRALLVDSGDFFLGSPESAASRGLLPAAALAAIGYDALVPSARDLAGGPAALAHWRKDSAAALLAANLAWSGPDAPRPWIRREIDGISVALIGLTQSDAALHLRPEFIPGLRVTPAEEALRRLLPELRSARPDVRILVLHAGGAARGGADSEARRILREFPDLDLVIGGRAGEVTAEFRSGEGPLYAEAGENAEWVGRVDLVFDTVTRRVASAKGSLLSARSGFQSDGDLRQKLQAGLTAAETLLAAPCASLPAPGDGEVHVLLPALPVREPPARNADVLRLFPADHPLGSFTCLAHDLETALAAAPADAAARLWLRGAAFERAGNTARLVAPDGTALNPRKSLRVTADARLLASAGGDFAALRQLADRSGVAFGGQTVHELWRVTREKPARGRP